MALLVLGSTLEVQAQGQRQGRSNRGSSQQRMSRSALLRVEAVQEELNITEDQLAQFGELRGQRRGGGERGQGGEGRQRPMRGGEGAGERPQRGGERGQRGDDAGGERPQRGGERGQRGGEAGGERPQRGGERGQRGGQSTGRAQAELDQLATVLNKDQLQRLNEIFVQVAGVAVLQDEIVAKELEISEEQVEEMQELRSEMRAEIRDAMSSGDRESMREKISQMNEELREKTMAVLTASQQDDLDEMKGKKFEMPEDAMPQRRSRNRGGSGGNN